MQKMCLIPCFRQHILKCEKKCIIVFGMCMNFPKTVVTFWHVQLIEVNKEMKKFESEERRDEKEKGGKKREL